VAALKALADRLGLVALMDRHLPLSRRPLSIGTTLLLAAINRAVWPCSKRGWATGAPRPALPQLCPLRPAALTRPDVWDQRDAGSESALEAIEADLTRQVIQEFHLTLDTLFYDTTNFFTYIASGNERSALAQRGHSKPQRPDLRPCCLALLVARDGQMRSLQHQLTTRWAALQQGQQTVATPGSGPRTATGARQRVAAWGAGP